jgi:hypothetical protein
VFTGVGTVINISAITGAVLTVDTSANYPASGLYNGKILYALDASGGLLRQVVVSSFVTTGTRGSTTYYVTEITLTEIPSSSLVQVAFGGLTIGYSATGGTIAPAANKTCYKIMAVTQMLSGGLRASEEFSVDIEDTITAGVINLGFILGNSSLSGQMFAFDIPTQATTWFMTLGFDPTLPATDLDAGPAQTYYLIPSPAVQNALDVSGSPLSNINPTDNATYSFDLVNAVAGTENTLLDQFGFEQAYFTEQVDSPPTNMVRMYNDFLFYAGDDLFPNRVWISQLDAPQIMSEYGRTLGSFLDIAPDDSDYITGMYVWSNFLYVFKSRAIYRVSFTGNASAPFQVDKIAGVTGAVSHFAIQETPQGLVYLSQYGPARCSWYYSEIIGNEVLPYFDSNFIQYQYLPTASAGMTRSEIPGKGHFEQSQFSYSSSLNYTLKKQLWFTVASRDGGIRDKILVLDYQTGSWWLQTNVFANYLAPITDANNFVRPWSGDISGRLFRHDFGDLDEVASDGTLGHVIPEFYRTPNIFPKSIGDSMTPRKAYLAISRLSDNPSALSGSSRESGLVYADVFTNRTDSMNEASRLTWSGDKGTSRTGAYSPVNAVGDSIQFVFRNDPAGILRPEINAFRLDFQNQAPRMA